MSIVPEYKEITKDDLELLQPLILPDIYDELTEQDDISTEYICLSAWFEDIPVGAIITDLEDSGDLSLLSIWTAPAYRRMGIASALRDKMTEVAVNLYDWDDGQFGDDVILKTMYSLRDEFRKPFEAWLQKNDFTEFCILKEADGEKPEICSATAEIHFMRYSG